MTREEATSQCGANRPEAPGPAPGVCEFRMKVMTRFGCLCCREVTLAPPLGHLASFTPTFVLFDGQEKVTAQLLCFLEREPSACQAWVRAPGLANDDVPPEVRP